jgi:hypothetical protein
LDVGIRGTLAVCDAKNQVAGEVPFTAFIYPGMVAGNAFTWNKEGIVITINYLSPLQLDMGEQLGEA